MKLAKKLAIQEEAVYQWLSGKTSPHPARAIRISQLANRRRTKLSLDEIYEHFREIRSERYATPHKPQPARI